MYKRITMKADYEAWWNFEDMEDKFIEEVEFDTVEAYEEDARKTLSLYRELFEHEKTRDGIYYVFWNDGEYEFCEGCDEDLQIYYSIILSHSLTMLVK